MALKGLGLGRLFQRQEEGQPSPAEEKQYADKLAHLEATPGTTILIADDSRSIHAVVGRMLSRHGYSILAAYDGESAITVTREQRPSLILMDVVMPGMNGFQATREIRKDADPTVAEIPVLIMSGNAQPSEELWSTKIKANGFLAKPFGEDELLTNLERLLFPGVAAV